MTQSTMTAPVKKANLQAMTFGKLKTIQAEQKKQLRLKLKADRETFREKQKLETLALAERHRIENQSIADAVFEMLNKSDILEKEGQQVKKVTTEVASKARK